MNMDFVWIAVVLIPVVYALGFSGCAGLLSDFNQPEPDKPAQPPPKLDEPSQVPPVSQKPANYEDTIRNTGNLAAWWRFEEAEQSGQTEDSSPDGVKNPGRYEGALQSFRLEQTDSVAGRSVFFNPGGVANPTAHVSVDANNGGLELFGNFSLEIWLKPDIEAMAGPALCCGHYVPAANDGVEQGYGLEVSKPSGSTSLQLRVRFGVKAKPTAPALAPPVVSGDLVRDAWNHVVVSAERGPKELGIVRLYVNGQEVPEAAARFDDFTYLAPPSSTAFLIGAGWRFAQPSPAPYYFYRGLIDEVAVYQDVLSRDTVKAHYAAGLKKPS